MTATSIHICASTVGGGATAATSAASCDVIASVAPVSAKVSIVSLPAKLTGWVAVTA